MNAKKKLKTIVAIIFEYNNNHNNNEVNPNHKNNYDCDNNNNRDHYLGFRHIIDGNNHCYPKKYGKGTNLSFSFI